MKKRLLQITHDLDLGGLQQVVVNLCRCINREEYEIRVLCLREKGMYTDQLEEINVPVDLIKQEQGTDYLSFMKVARYLKEHQIDIIHTHNTQPLIDGTLGSIFSGRRCHIIHTDHARNFPDKMRYMLAEHFMSYYVNKMVGVSRHTTQNLIKYEKIPQRKTCTIENGIYGDIYKKNINRDAKLDELNIEKNAFVIGSAGRFSEQKGLKYLIQAMPGIIKKISNVHLILAGDGELRSDLEDLATKLEVSSKVSFIGSRKDMPEILKIFDVFILPSLWEGLPMIILEAMATMLPIIASDVGGISRAVKDKETGILIQPGSVYDIEKQLVYLYNNKEFMERIANNAVRYFDQEFEARTMAKEYEKLYEDR